MVFQTLTTLMLGFNRSGPEGAQYLANALQINKVTTILFSIHTHTHGISDTHQTISSKGSNWRRRSTISSECTTNKQCNRNTSCRHTRIHMILKTLVTLDVYCNEIGSEGARYLANTLETNEVTATPLLGTRIHMGFQILTKLDLRRNQIGEEGARCLGIALGTNSVITTLVVDTHMHAILQTLATLKLSYNEIGAEGARHLANALQTNKVTRTLLFETHIRG